jgi:hypothetical protein
MRDVIDCTCEECLEAADNDLGVSERDLMFADLIIDDFSEFEEGIAVRDKLAQWVRNIRAAAETGQGLARFRTDWDEKLKERFPNGVTPQETPFWKMLSRS